MVDKEKRTEPRDPGEQEQNKAINLGLADAPEGEDVPSKCPTCGRDHVKTA